MIQRPRYLTLAISVALCLSAVAKPSSGQEPFYKGKTIRIIVGFAPGGGYDIHSRLIARHMWKYIPGNPTIIVENMAGASSLISANYVYRVVKPDGLSIGNISGGLFLQQLLGKPGIEFDGANFEQVGAPAQGEFMVGLSKATGITSVSQWMASGTVLKLGGVAPGASTDDIPKVLKATLGLPIQLVSGYKGTAPIRLAFHSGEVQGLCSSWDSFKATWRKEVETGEIVFVLQATVKPHPELPNVPVAYDLAKTEEARKLIQAITRVHGVTNRPYVLPPGTPKERVNVLRKAFMDTMKDPDFLAEANKASLDLNPLDGEEFDQNVKALFRLEPPLVDRLKEILR